MYIKTSCTILPSSSISSSHGLWFTPASHLTVIRLHGLVTCTTLRDHALHEGTVLSVIYNAVIYPEPHTHVRPLTIRHLTVMCITCYGASLSFHLPHALALHAHVARTLIHARTCACWLGLLLGLPRVPIACVLRVSGIRWGPSIPRCGRVPKVRSIAPLIFHCSALPCLHRCTLRQFCRRFVMVGGGRGIRGVRGFVRDAGVVGPVPVMQGPRVQTRMGERNGS